MKLFSVVYFLGAAITLCATVSGFRRAPSNGKRFLRDANSFPQLSKWVVAGQERRVVNDRTNSTLSMLKPVMLEFPNNPTNIWYCRGCQLAVEFLRLNTRNGKTSSTSSYIKSICYILNIQSAEVCDGIAELFGPELVPILNSGVSSLVICSILLSQECTKILLPQWRTNLPASKVMQNLEPSVIPANGPVLKVLHVTDTHFDSLYKEGSRAECSEPLCCRQQPGADSKERLAGKFGDWNCDVPEITLDSMFQHVKKRHPDLDYIIFTGDVPPHDIWKQTKYSNFRAIEDTVKKFQTYFPGVPVFPAVGNHEAAPTDIFPPPGASHSVSWLYDALDMQWRRWLPPDTSETIRHGGFYTTLVRPGLRIVSLNSNYCYYRNWWLMLNSTDPADQLQWMAGVLQHAEENGEKVHVIGHIAPGQIDCLPTWRDNYYRMVSRFRHVITNHFFGHSHRDEFELYYDDRNLNEAVGVGFLGPSLTTYKNLNPGYRMYYVDGDRNHSTRFVLDYENWILDLERSNRLKAAKWGKSYSAKSEYGMQSLSPAEWNNFYEKIKKSDTLFQLYYRHSHKDSPRLNVLGCDQTCKKKVLCSIKSCQKYRSL